MNSLAGMRLLPLTLLLAAFPLSSFAAAYETIPIGTSGGTTVGMWSNLIPWKRSNGDQLVEARLIEKLAAPTVIPEGVAVVRGMDPHLLYVRRETTFEIDCSRGELKQVSEHYWSSEHENFVASRMTFDAAPFKPAADTHRATFFKLACERGTVLQADVDREHDRRRERFRAELKVGDETNCGLVIETKPPLAVIETPENGVRHIPIGKLFESSERCEFREGRYVPPHGT